MSITNIDWSSKFQLQNQSLARLGIHLKGSSTDAISVGIVAGFITVFLLTIAVVRKQTSKPPPPNLPSNLKLPIVQPWRVYYDWAKKFGPVLSLSLPGMPARKVILISGHDVLHELYTTRSGLYSTRPLWRMAYLIGRQNNVAFTPYGDRLKIARRFLIAELGAKQVNSWGQLLDREVMRFMRELVAEDDDAERGTKVSELLHAHISDVITLLTYGHRASPSYIAASEAINRDTGTSLIPGRWAVEGAPFLKYVPAFLPGMGFKKWAVGAKQRFEALIGREFEEVQKGYEAGIDNPCFVTKSLASAPLDAQEINVLRSTAGSLYSAATDTTTAILHSALHVLSLHPDIQRTAYEKVSALARMPEISDEARLPYITAFIRELHRFRPVVNLISHAPLTDDEYAGYKIEKGVWVMGNLWSIVHDPEIYPDPEVFKPERYLQPNGKIDSRVKDPRTVTFGYGRRKCPGEHFANAHVFLAVSRLIRIFEILPSDSHLPSGGELEKRLEYTSTFISLPKKENFSVKLKLRDEGLRETILGGI